MTEPGLLGHEAGILETLEELWRHGVVSRFTDGLEPVFAVGQDQHLVAAFYRNGAIHFFVNRAVGELAVARLADGEHRADPLAEAWAEALRLRDLLKFEFFFPKRSEYAEQLRRELDIIDPGDPAKELTAALGGARLHLAHRVLSSFVEAYWIVADRLAARNPRSMVDEKELLAESLAAGRQYLLQHRIHSPESVSVELFGNALKLAANRGLIAPDDERLAEQRRLFADELATIVRRLRTIGELAVRDLKLAADARACGTQSSTPQRSERR
jgi:glycerol-3-phosphate O-acyltransferase